MARGDRRRNAEDKATREQHRSLGLGYRPSAPIRPEDVAQGADEPPGSGPEPFGSSER